MFWDFGPSSQFTELESGFQIAAVLIILSVVLLYLKTVLHILLFTGCLLGSGILLNKVQKKAIEMIKRMEYLPYEERIEHLELFIYFFN